MAVEYRGNITEEQIDKLKDCPFCGQHELDVRVTEERFKDNIIRCKCCGGKMQICSEFGIDKLIENWNSRV